MMSKQTENSATLLRYCVGIDVSKDSLQICLSTIDTNGKTTVKGTSKVANKVSSFDGLLTWIVKHCKEKQLPVRYLMESTAQAALWRLSRTNCVVFIPE
jgi:transposase